jgi:hypothetical protein
VIVFVKSCEPTHTLKSRIVITPNTSCVIYSVPTVQFFLDRSTYCRCRLFRQKSQSSISDGFGFVTLTHLMSSIDSGLSTEIISSDLVTFAAITTVAVGQEYPLVELI